MTAWLVIAAQAGLAATLAVAAMAKVHDPVTFGAALALSPLTRRARKPLATLVPAVELAFATALVLAPAEAVPAVLFATSGLMVLLTAWLVSVMARGVSASCACFGPGERPIGPRSLARNLALAGLAAGAGVLASGASGVALADVELLARAVLVSTGVLLAGLLIGVQRARPAMLLDRTDITEEGTA